MHANSFSSGVAGRIGIPVLRLALFGGLIAGALVVGAAVGTAGDTTPTETPDLVTLRSQLGKIYAQQGHKEQARQEFVKLLEVPAGRAAALTNLGNLAFVDGQVGEAIASYEQAAALDAKDPGILLNLGLAFKVSDQPEKADQTFAQAVEMAGGVEKASYLLGLPTGDDTSRGKVSKMTADEMRQMLAKAQTQVPKTGTEAKKVAEKPEVASRPGGARADQLVGEQSLYWKDK